MAKRKKRKPKKATNLRTIPASANPVRFLIFLTIGVILFFIFFVYLVIRSRMPQM
jgi:hypothetical protein